MASDVARKFQHMKCIPCCMLLCGQFFVPAFAQESADPMEVCYRMSDPQLRHACFDQEMQRRHAAGTGAAGTNAARTAPVVPTDTVGLDGRQLIIRRKEEGIQPETVKPMSVAIARLKPRPDHLYYFELDNGQVWESTDSEADLFLGPHENVLIRPGVLGAFFLKTAQGRSIRVHRLR